MFCLVDDKGVIHKPEPKGSRVGEGGEGLHFKLFHKDVCYEGADGGTHGFFPIVSTHICPKHPPLLIYNKSYTSVILVSSFIYFV